MIPVVFISIHDFFIPLLETKLLHDQIPRVVLAPVELVASIQGIIVKNLNKYVTFPTTFLINETDTWD